MKKDYEILHLECRSYSDKKQQVSLFGLFFEKERINNEFKIRNVRGDFSYSVIHNYLQDEGFYIHKFRLLLPNIIHNLDNQIRLKDGNPFGYSSEKPLFSINEKIHPLQYQSNIIEYVPEEPILIKKYEDISFFLKPLDQIDVVLFCSKESKKQKHHDYLESNIQLNKSILVSNDSEDELYVNLLDRVSVAYLKHKYNELFNIQLTYCPQVKYDDMYNMLKENENYFSKIRIVGQNIKSVYESITINGEKLKNSGTNNDISIDVFAPNSPENTPIIEKEIKFTIAPKSKIILNFH